MLAPSHYGIYAALLGSLALASGRVGAQPVFVPNGDFESGIPSGGGALGWDDFTTPGMQEFETIQGDANTGMFFGRIENTQPASPALIKSFGLGVIDDGPGFAQVSPGDLVEVSFFARGTDAVGGVQFAQIFSEKAGEGTSKSEILGGGPLFVPSATTWTEYTFVTTLGTDVTRGVTLQFEATTGGAPGSMATLDIDDVTLEVLPSTPGDFNADGNVDAADYTVWRDNFGAVNESALLGGGDGMNGVDINDYILWRDEFGGGMGNVTTAPIPEPTAAAICGLGLFFAGFRSRRH